MSQQKNDFGEGSIARNIMGMAIPMTVAQILNILYNLVDRMYLGHIPGETVLPLTGVGLTFPLVTMVTAFSGLFGMGGAPLCSIARGEGDMKRAEQIMQNSFWLLSGAGVILTIVFLLFQKPLLYAFGASDATYPYASGYLTIYLLGSIFVMIALGMNPFINSQGFGKVGMTTVALGAIINIVLDPVFIFIFNMGVKGAALATIIAQFCSCMWVLHFLTGKKAILRLKIEKPQMDWALVKQITVLGTSNFIVNFTNSLVQITCNSQLQKYGGDLYVGVMTILNSVREVVSMPIMGIVNGAQPVIGFNYGAKKYDRVKQGIKFMTMMGVIYTCAIWAVILLFPEPFIIIFNNDPAILRAGVESLHIYFFGFCFMALQFAGQATFQALGEARYSITFSLFRKVVIVVPLTILLPLIPAMGLNGVFWAEPISNLVGGSASFFTMLAVIWFGKLNPKKVRG